MHRRLFQERHILWGILIQWIYKRHGTFAKVQQQQSTINASTTLQHLPWWTESQIQNGHHWYLPQRRNKETDNGRVRDRKDTERETYEQQDGMEHS